MDVSNELVLRPARRGMGLIRTPPHVPATPRSWALSYPGKLPGLPPTDRSWLPLTHCLGLQLIGG